MLLRAISISVVVLFASLGATPRAEAVPVVSLDPSNQGIGTLGTAFDPTTNTITIAEVWTSNAMGSLLLSGLDESQNYVVIKQ
ncbi:MAG: hypothetical protein ABIS29_00035, partial [Vicinamibacterales bacterium]